MTKELSTAVFDYSDLDKDVKGKLIALAGTIKREKAKHSQSGLEIGKAIACAHAELAGDGGDGRFSEWVEMECGFGRTTAYNYMWTWQRFGNCSSLEQFTQEALYALASPKAPAPAVKEAEKLADKGHKITLDKAKELLDKFREVEAKAKPRRATSAAAPSPAGTPDLPPEGTANQTDQGSQGKGAQAGACIRTGGDHRFGTDDEGDYRCLECGEPGAKQYADTFDPAEMAGDGTDAMGNEAPDDLRHVFDVAGEFDEQRAKLTAIKSWITQRVKHDAGAKLAGAAQRIKTDIDNADRELRFAKPHCVCVYCHNKPPKVANCNACKGTGWITEDIYKNAPKGMKHGKAERQTVSG